MTEETIETTTTNTLKNGNRYIERITMIRSYWTNMNPRIKSFFIGYGLITTSCYTVYNYNDGSNALTEFRTKYPTGTSIAEIRAIRDGIKSYDNFWSALFFPLSISEKIMPNLVLALNPKTSIIKGPALDIDSPTLREQERSKI